MCSGSWRRAWARSSPTDTGAALGREVGDEHAPIPVWVLDHGDGLAHPRMLEEHPVDLGRLHAQTANLDLPIGAVAVLDGAVPAQPHHVAAGVQAIVGIPRRAHEPLGGEFRIAEIPARQRSARDEQFAGHTRRNGTHRPVQDVHRHVATRTPDRHDALIAPVRLTDPDAS